MRGRNFEGWAIGAIHQKVLLGVVPTVCEVQIHSLISLKAKLEKMENEKKFEFSEMYIFGKFDTFSKRLTKIIEMFETFEMYSHLSDSKIEGTNIRTQLSFHTDGSRLIRMWIIRIPQKILSFVETTSQSAHIVILHV